MPESNAAAARELREWCNGEISQKVCRDAVDKHKGDVTKALASLIDSGRVRKWNLNARVVPGEFFVRAERWSLEEDIRRYDTFIRVDPNVAALRKQRQELVDRLRNLLKDKGAGKRLRKEALGMMEIGERIEALKKRPTTLKLAPFPPLKLDTDEWAGTDRLSSWAGYQARGGAYASRSSSRPSKGEVRVEVPRAAGDEDDVEPTPPAKEMVAAYRQFKENERAITKKVVEAVFKEFVAMKKRGYFELFDEDEVPVIKNAGELKRHLGLGTVHVLDWAKGGHAYIGLEMGCTWDEEHGAGVLLHKSRVVAVGQADTSFDSHEAKKDGGKQIKT